MGSWSAGRTTAKARGTPIWGAARPIPLVKGWSRANRRRWSRSCSCTCETDGGGDACGGKNDAGTVLEGPIESIPSLQEGPRGVPVETSLGTRNLGLSWSREGTRVGRGRDFSAPHEGVKGSGELEVDGQPLGWESNGSLEPGSPFVCTDSVPVFKEGLLPWVQRKLAALILEWHPELF